MLADEGVAKWWPNCDDNDFQYFKDATGIPGKLDSSAQFFNASIVLALDSFNLLLVLSSSSTLVVHTSL